MRKNIHCTNGGCTKPIYRGSECYRCWLGTKWDSMKQRVEDRSGRYKWHRGLPLGFTRTEFIKWGMENKPPKGMEKPSVDRVNNKDGYIFGNIRWLSFRKNSSGVNRDLPSNRRRCPICKTVKMLSARNFRPHKSGVTTHSYYCIPCEREYKREWARDKARRIK